MVVNVCVTVLVARVVACDAIVVVVSTMTRVMEEHDVTVVVDWGAWVVNVSVKETVSTPGVGGRGIPTPVAHRVVMLELLVDVDAGPVANRYPAITAADTTATVAMTPIGRTLVQ